MVNISSEIAAIAVIFLVTAGILTWSFYRAKPYGQLGILAWLQYFVLIAPWLIFFGLFAAGIYLNLAVILFLLVASTIIYIYLGNRLRLLKTNQIIEPKVNPAVSQSVTPLETPAAGDSNCAGCDANFRTGSKSYSEYFWDRYFFCHRDYIFSGRGNF
jgi:hypothetical protein